MAEILLSEAEKMFIIHGVQDDLRVDGRSRLDYRPIEIETSVVPTANGSSRLRLGNTEILVGVKADIGTPTLTRPNHGRIEFFVDCSANASPEFEGRGGEALANELSQSLLLAYKNPNGFDLTQLGIISGQSCWLLNVDILILECGGNLYDTISLAVIAALRTCQVAKVEASNIDGGKPEICLSDNEMITFNSENCPCLVTFCKIGSNCVVDASPEEEECCRAMLVVGVNRKGITFSKKVGEGSFLLDTLQSAFKSSVIVGESLLNAFDKAIEEEISLRSVKKNAVGFLHRN